MTKIIYISAGFPSQVNGASQVTKRNRECLVTIFGKENVMVYTIEKIGGLLPTLSSLIGSSYGISFSEEYAIVNKAKTFKCDYAFIEGSLYGNLVCSLEKSGIKTIVFCHNIESKLFREHYFSNKSPSNKLRLWLCERNEKKSFDRAYKVITLNNRDSQTLHDSHGREPDAEIPITYRKYIRKNVSSYDKNKYLLFVGSDFFPNVEGIIWFIKNVATHVKYGVHVVGSCGFNSRIKELQLPGNVKILGYVDNLDTEYENASAVIEPIFLGSGMKTKTIEAMSYGKTIFGTEEAFVGIEGDIDRIGKRCDNAAEFINAINEHCSGAFNEYTDSLFREKYTDEVALKLFEKFFSAIS